MRDPQLGIYLRNANEFAMPNNYQYDAYIIINTPTIDVFTDQAKGSKKLYNALKNIYINDNTNQKILDKQFVMLNTL